MAAEFIKKKKFYDNIKSVMAELDNKLLIAELVPGCDFTEGRILKELLYETGYCYGNRINELSCSVEDFKEYVEMWIHEVKIPLSSLMLMNYNRNDDVVTRSAGLSELDNYLEQILYYVRSENAQKDYIISDCRLSKLIAAVAVKNKDDILENNIDFQVENADADVCTDSKWLEFILNQIISNSIKYRDEKKTDGSVIKIYVVKNDKSTVLNIYDNGIGIPAADLPRVFDKSFTGENGHAYSKATGMGMYIVKNLCEKLGHKITIESVKGEYTLVSIEFFKNDFYKETLVLRNIM